MSTNPLLSWDNFSPLACSLLLVFANLPPEAVQQAFAVMKVLCRFPAEIKKSSLHIIERLSGDMAYVFSSSPKPYHCVQR